MAHSVPNSEQKTDLDFLTDATKKSSEVVDIREELYSLIESIV